MHCVEGLLIFLNDGNPNIGIESDTPRLKLLIMLTTHVDIFSVVIRGRLYFYWQSFDNILNILFIGKSSYFCQVHIACHFLYFLLFSATLYDREIAVSYLRSTEQQRAICGGTGTLDTARCSTAVV